MVTEGLSISPYTQRINLTYRPPSGRRSSQCKRSTKIDESDCNLENISKYVTQNFSTLKKLFQIFDVKNTFTVTQHEFKDVLFLVIGNLTQQQFRKIINDMHVNSDGTVSYANFLESYFNKDSMRDSEIWLKLMHKRLSAQSIIDAPIDSIEQIIKQRLVDNAEVVKKAFYLLDYNRDGHIQRHEMRRILENFCLKLSDSQFDKLWARYDSNRSGIANYHDFFRRMGILVNDSSNQDTQPKTATTSTSTEHPYRHMTFPELEREFRRLMRRNYKDLVKVCLAFDPHRENMMPLDNLRSILTRFTIPLSAELFDKLLTKIGFKATGYIPWVQFLDHFRDQFIPNDKENSLPIKPAHKFLPHKPDKSEQLTATELIQLLHTHVDRNYSSVKAAFLAFDPDRKGTIVRKDLRRVIESFAFKLTDDQFKELVILLDPTHQGFIDYIQFLELFEVKDTNEGHRIVNTDRFFQDKRLDYQPAYSTVEEIIRDKLRENFSQMRQSVFEFDCSDSPLLTKDQLRSIIVRHALPIQSDHLEKLWSQLTHVNDNRVRAAEFVKLLDIRDDSAGDLKGLSSHITEENEQFLAERREDHDNRMNFINVVGDARSNAMHVSEILLRLRDKIHQKSDTIRKEFLRYDSDRDGRVKRREFKKILEKIGLQLDTTSFGDLCDYIRFPFQGLTYSDFLAVFQDPRIDGPAQDIIRAGNHVQIPHLSDTYKSADSILPLLKNKFLHAANSFSEVFFHGDMGRKGYWTWSDFRAALDKNMIFVTSEEFEKLMDIIGLKEKSRLSYHQFLDLFQERSGFQKYQESSYVSPPEVSDPSDMMADQVHEILQMKASGRFPDLIRAFQSLAKDINGFITKSELRRLLWKFNLPMNQSEFEKLWNLYDQRGVGKVSFGDFQNMLGMVFAPGDEQGTSTRIAAGNCAAIDHHIEDQKARHNEITMRQLQATKEILTAAEVEDQLRTKFSSNFTSLYKAFRNCDVRRNGYIPTDDLYNILLEHNYVMDPDTFLDLLARLDLPTETQKINYERFLRNIDSNKKSRHARPYSAPMRAKDTEIRVEKWSINRVIEKLKMMVTENKDVIIKALQSFDDENTGRVKATELRRVLESFCFKLGDQQFKGVLRYLHVYQDFTVSYSQFFEEFLIQDADAKTECVKELRSSAKTPQPSLPMKDVEVRLRERVTASFYDFAEMFRECDYGQIGVISSDDFRSIIHHLAFRVSDEQFASILSLCLTNEFGHVDYRDFLKTFSMQGKLSHSDHDVMPQSAHEAVPQSAHTHVVDRPKTAPKSVRSQEDMPLSVRPRCKSATLQRSHTSLVDANTTEMALRQAVFKHWNSILKKCRLHDIHESGSIPTHKFRDILADFQVHLNDEELRTLAAKFGVVANGRFAYSKFLRYFVINLKYQSSTRRTINTPKSTKIHTNEEHMTAELLSALHRVRETVVRDWKTMRRLFKQHDLNSCGKLSGRVSLAEFKQVLHQSNINLSEDDFFLLCDHFDHKLSGKFNYNEFLRTFLK